jgi:hypothetical protein
MQQREGARKHATPRKNEITKDPISYDSTYVENYETEKENSGDWGLEKTE